MVNGELAMEILKRKTDVLIKRLLQPNGASQVKFYQGTAAGKQIMAKGKTDVLKKLFIFTIINCFFKREKRRFN